MSPKAKKPETKPEANAVDALLPALSDEVRVQQLLPQAVEAWDPPSKRIAERRIAGWRTSHRSVERGAWRPCGNSRKFWKKVEDDDPFLAAPGEKRVAQDGHAVYAAERLVRMPDAPKVDRPTEHAPPPPQPKRLASPPPRPEPTYTEEPRPAPAPKSVPRPPPAAARPAPPPVDDWDDEPAPPPIDRTPPRPTPQGKTSTGRVPVAPARPMPAPRIVDASGRSATEVRQEREQWRAAAKGPAGPPPLRKYDDVLAILGELKASQALYEQGIKGNLNADIDDKPRPTPKPNPTPAAAAPRPSPQPPTQPARPSPPPQRPAPPPTQARPSPPPRAAEPDDDDEWDEPPSPPAPKAPAAQAPVNRSPSGRGAATSGGLDDLFGGGPQEGRVRIPKRPTKPAKPDDDG